VQSCNAELMVGLCTLLLKIFYHVKSFQSHKTHRAVLTSVSLALSQTPVYTARHGHKASA